MRIGIAQLNYQIGDLVNNQHKILAAIEQAKSHQVELLVFSELSIGGYPAQDFLFSNAFIDACENSALEIAQHCDTLACLVGLPVRNRSGKGKALFNAAALLYKGEIQASVHKSLLPDYDVFNEYRYFEPGSQSACVDFKGVKLGVTICEDLWNLEDSPLYGHDPLEHLMAESPDFIINIAASPFSVGHFDRRMSVLSSQAQKFKIPLIYVNQVGAYSELIFDGTSMVLDEDGELRAKLPSFDEDFYFFDLESLSRAPQGESKGKGLDEAAPLAEIGWIHQALVFGLKDYFQKSGFKKAILGLSGGLDSAIVAALACEALGAENVLAVLMPSQYSSDHSLKDALDLVKNTGCSHEIIAIQPAVHAFESMLAEPFAGFPADLTEENIQARTRAVVLMALSNKLGHILLNTSNKSESAVGYGTLYGDMAGAISVIGDVFKTQVFDLARYINREREIIPLNTITKPPSAELRPDQKDSDSLPDYAILDPILHAYIELEKDKDDIKSLAFDAALVERVVTMVDRAEFKRKQGPPVLRVSRKAFGSGRSMPLVAKKSNW